MSPQFEISNGNMIEVTTHKLSVYPYKRPMHLLKYVISSLVFQQHVNLQKLIICLPLAEKVQYYGIICPLQWHHNEHDGISNHWCLDWLLNRLFRHRSKKTSKLSVTGHCKGNHQRPVNTLHKGPVTRRMFPFHDVIMPCRNVCIEHHSHE